MTSQDNDSWAKIGRGFKPKDIYDGLARDSAGSFVETVNEVAPLSSASSILDVGSGSGAVFAELLDRFGTVIPDSAPIVAIDSSPGLIAALAERQKEQAEFGNVAWARVTSQVMSATDMSSLQESSFSHVFCANTLYAVSDYEKALQEAKRIVKPGGIYAFSLNAEIPWIDLMRFVTKVRPDKVIPTPHARWQSEQGCRGVLESAGFTVLETRMADCSMPWEDHKVLVEFLTSTLPFMPRIWEGMSDAEVKKSKELMLAYLEEAYPTLPARMKGKAVIAVGRKG